VFAAVIVTFRPPEGLLLRAVDSVVQGGGVDLVVVVDNGSLAMRVLQDRLAATEGCRVEVLVSPGNLGFGAGANVGFRRCIEAGAEFIALLNDDLHVDAGWTEPLVAALRADVALGAVQPKLLFAGSNPPRVNSVGVSMDRYGAGHDIGLGEPDGPEFADAGPIDMFTGGAVVFRREFLEATRMFDEHWFLYYEDVDLALRGARLGWRYRCEPSSVVWHHGSASSVSLGDRTRFLQERNRLWALARHGSLAGMGRGLWLSVRRLRHAPRASHARALAAGVAGWPRQWWSRI
jgi:GT2 family glycosyltransferase